MRTRIIFIVIKIVKHCKAIFISDESSDYSTAWEIAAVDKLEKNKVDFLLWSNSKYEPIVLFSIAHTKNSILLKYEVSEQYTTARYSEINDPVFRDSCVEFFIGFDDDDYYYNLEFNCLGTPLVGYGSGDKGRKIIDKDLVGKINSLDTFSRDNLYIILFLLIYSMLS